MCCLCSGTCMMRINYVYFTFFGSDDRDDRQCRNNLPLPNSVAGSRVNVCAQTDDSNDKEYAPRTSIYCRINKFVGYAVCATPSQFQLRPASFRCPWAWSQMRLVSHSDDRFSLAIVPNSDNKCVYNSRRRLHLDVWWCALLPLVLCTNILCMFVCASAKHKANV